MNLSSSKMPRSMCFSLVLSLIMLLVPAILIPFWVNKAKRIESEIKVYASANQEDVLFNHFHNTMKFGFMLIILMMVTLVISIVAFVIITIRAGRREMNLSDELIKQKEATQQEEMKSMNKSTAFVQATHDFRVALVSISGLIELCRHTQASPESKLVNYLNIMDSCTNDLLSLLNSILDQSKIEEGKKHLKEEEFNMEELLEHVVNMNYPNGAMKNVDVLLDPCNGSVSRFAHVKGDRGEVRRILSNLLHNAIKFTSEGHIVLRAWARKPGFDKSHNPSSNASTGWLSLLHMWKAESSVEVQVLNRVQQDPNCMEFVFEVEDTGKGIPKGKQKSVFENFVEVDDGSQTGTGLGLGITQSLVRLMGGRIGIVDKQIGERGTCFRFNIFLIACDQPQAQEHQAREEDLESQLGGGSVASSRRLKPETSNVILFIKEEERSRVLRRFMTNILGLKVHVVNQHDQYFSHTLKKVNQHEQLSHTLKNVSPHEQFSQTLKKVKENIINFPSNNSSPSSRRSREIPLSALYVTDIDDCIDISSSQRRGRGFGSRRALISFILIIIDTSAESIREINQAMAEFRKDFPKNVFLRVVWLDKPGVDEDKLPSTDIVMAKPLHGSNLYRALGDVPEFRDKILPTITQEMKEETIQQPLMRRSTSSQKDVFVENLPLIGKKILLVEDDPTSLMLWKKMVSKLGATTYTCKNGKEAVDDVCKALSDQPEIGPSTPSPPFDYILMDCEMPEMNGFEATKCIRKEEARYEIQIPIIALTAHTDEEVIDKIFQAGTDSYLPKPLMSDLLLKAIDNIENRKIFHRISM